MSAILLSLISNLFFKISIDFDSSLFLHLHVDFYVSGMYFSPQSSLLIMWLLQMSQGERTPIIWAEEEMRVKMSFSPTRLHVVWASVMCTCTCRCHMEHAVLMDFKMPKLYVFSHLNHFSRKCVIMLSNTWLWSQGFAANPLPPYIGIYSMYMYSS